MVRSAAIALLTVILPAFAAAQETTHTVTSGNTLWGLARQYLGDPYQWPRIHEANRDQIPNPHRIEPGLVIRIPGAQPQAQVGAVQVMVQPGPAAMPAQPMPMQEVPQRTVFYRERQAAVTGVSRLRGLWDVPPAQFYSAPWLIPPGTVPERSGAIESLAGGGAGRTSARAFDQLEVRLDGASLSVGTRLQSFRVERSITDVGHVVQPTGILVVQSVAPQGVIAMVESQYESIDLGDLVRVLPPYTPLPIDSSLPVTGGTVATVLAYATERAIQSMGDHAFLNVGAVDGVSIGDEYVAVVDPAPEFGEMAEGRLKVVAVLQNVATARIVHLENPIFVPGVRLRPDRRVR